MECRVSKPYNPEQPGVPNYLASSIFSNDKNRVLLFQGYLEEVLGLTDDVAGGGRKRDDYHETKFPNNFLAAICTSTIFRHFLNVHSKASKEDCHTNL